MRLGGSCIVKTFLLRLCDLTALVLEHYYSIGYRTERAPLAQFPRLHQRLPDCLASTRQIRALSLCLAIAS